VTPAIVAITVGYFILMSINGVAPMSPKVADILAWGGNFGPYTLSGEWWRLASCMFVHIGILHIAFNMWVLWDIGQLVERLVGPVGFLILYVVTGVGGSIASLVWNVNVVSAGASGAVFGVFGAFMSFVMLRSDTVPKEVLSSLRNSGMMFLGFNLLIGFSMKGIDMAAHLGGLGLGVLCGVVMSQPIINDPAILRGRLWRNLVVLVGGAGLLVGSWGLLLRPHVPQAQVSQILSKSIGALARAERKMEALNKRLREKKIKSAVYDQQVEKRVLPAWEHASKQLLTMKVNRFHPKAREVHALLLRYATMHRDSLRLWVKGGKTGNVKLRMEANKKRKEASLLVPQIEKLAKKFARKRRR
jgi:rhomboid protease GluP